MSRIQSALRLFGERIIRALATAHPYYLDPDCMWLDPRLFSPDVD